MELIQSIATKNPCYKTGKKIRVKGIMLSTVGCSQPSSKVLVHNWNKENFKGKCPHAIVDALTGNVIQMLPWNHRGWHCGKNKETEKSANFTHISIKLCEPAQVKHNKDYTIELNGSKEHAIIAAKKAYEGTIKLLAMLCKQFNLDPMSGIISQHEGYERGLCSENAQLENLWEILDLDYTMDKLRADVRSEMTLELIDKPVEVDEKETVTEEATIQTVEPKRQFIQVDRKNLRIRSTPMIGDNLTGKYTGEGVFEITEIQNGSGSNSGWGKLADGSGWVCLDYVKML